MGVVRDVLYAIKTGFESLDLIDLNRLQIRDGAKRADHLSAQISHVLNVPDRRFPFSDCGTWRFQLTPNLTPTASPPLSM